MLQVWKYQRNKIHKEVVSFQFEWSLAVVNTGIPLGSSPPNIDVVPGAVVNTGKQLGSSPPNIDVVPGGSKYW